MKAVSTRSSEKGGGLGPQLETTHRFETPNPVGRQTGGLQRKEQASNSTPGEFATPRAR